MKPVRRRPFLQVRIQDTVNSSALYDTGADISCIREDIFTQIPFEKRPVRLDLPRRTIFKGANGNQLEVKGKYKVAFETHGRKVMHEVFVISNLNEPVILGIDFIEAHELGRRSRVA